MGKLTDFKWLEYDIRQIEFSAKREGFDPHVRTLYMSATDSSPNVYTCCPLVLPYLYTRIHRIVPYVSMPVPPSIPSHTWRL